MANAKGTTIAGALVLLLGVASSWATLGCSGQLSEQRGGEDASADGAPGSAPEQVDASAMDAGAPASALDAGAPAESGSSSCPASFVDCQGSCINVKTDPHNCGACSHDCLGSACQSGACVVDPIYVGNGNGFPFGIAVDAASVYWASNMGNAIMKVPLDGGTPVTLATDQRPLRIAVDATSTYWTSQMGFVKSVPLGGGNPVTIASMPDGTSGIALDSSSVYFTAVNGNGTGSVIKAPLAGGTLTTLASGQDDPLDLALSSAAVYWVDADIAGMSSGSLMTVPIDGGAPVMLSPWANLASDAVAVDATSVYWNHGTTILKMPLAGGAPVTLVSQAAAYALAVDSANLYWTDQQMNAIMKVPVGGGTPVVVAKSFSTPRCLALDATNVYWTDISDIIMKAAK